MKETGIKTGGRKKGSVNVVTSDLRSRMLMITNELEAKILTKDSSGQTDLDKIRPDERLDYYVKLMGFLCPKPVEKEEATGETKYKELMDNILKTLSK